MEALEYYKRLLGLTLDREEELLLKIDRGQISKKWRWFVEDTLRTNVKVQVFCHHMIERLKPYQGPYKG